MRGAKEIPRNAESMFLEQLSVVEDEVFAGKEDVPYILRSMAASRDSCWLFAQRRADICCRFFGRIFERGYMLLATSY